MGHGGRWTFAVLVLAVLLLAACSPSSSGAASSEPAVVVEKNEETGLSRLTLSAKAAERLGIATASVIDRQGGGGRTVVPYSAVVYDPSGETWAYTNTDGLTFVRQPITVERIEADLAVLSAGPPIGTLVVTVGVAELWGIETGVGGGH
jgi:ABC-type oligopeptide transport system substrate-binding subunit